MIELNHNSTTIGEAMGLSEDTQDIITASIFFDIVNNDFQITQLFDNIDEAPKEMKTSSGILERCLKRANNKQEELFIVWEFAKTDFARSNPEHSKNFDGLLQSVAMMFLICNKDYDEFVKKFIDHKKQALREKDDN